MKKLIIASTSTIHGSGYLEYLLPTLNDFFKDVKTILFIPYARPSGISYDFYTEIVKKAFIKVDKNIVGIHEFENPKEAIQKAESGTLYLGTSAGSNICGITMMNTNDMPIVYPPSFNTLGLIPFNVNAHYLDPNPDSLHMGETRETRIKEFHVFNQTPVVGLREGSWLEVNGNDIILKGGLTARLFQQNKKPKELESDTVLSF